MGCVRPSTSWKYQPSDYKPSEREITLRHFVETNQEFINACKLADIKPTLLQGRKWRQKRGKAWQAHKAKAA